MAPVRAGARGAPRFEPSPGSAAGALRRLVLLLLVLGQTAAGAYLMTAVLPYHGERPLELAILSLFTVLFTWVSFGFWTAVAGFLVLATRRDRLAIGRTLTGAGEIPRDARTAVVMPICNEDVPRVFAGLRATYTSLARTGALERFDFYVLSDSSDADVRAAEMLAWLELCRAAGAFGRVFYRWRRHRIKRKSGNVADFCRRWGAAYRYMVVLDADSVMSGECLTSLVRMMEANPTTGIIQTAPRAARRETPFGRMQQFAIRVYGPLFAAGLSSWQLGASTYWGHNAIIRIAPFMRHCALARLPGRGSLSGEILSHDFVEAALMRRAGWAVWIAYDLPGSYEEVPATLEEELKRDWRWCRGNLMNARFCLAAGMHPSHRAVFLAGVMSYLSAPLWLLSLAVSTAAVAVQALVGPRYFLHPRQLFPIWPESHPGWNIALLLITSAVLFAPKVLGTLLALARGSQEFGGPGRLVLSAAAETVASALFAPVRMIFHAFFVPAALVGLRPGWSSPRRVDTETTWGGGTRRYLPLTIPGVALVVPAGGGRPGGVDPGGGHLEPGGARPAASPGADLLHPGGDPAAPGAAAHAAVPPHPRGGAEPRGPRLRARAQRLRVRPRGAAPRGPAAPRRGAGTGRRRSAGGAGGARAAAAPAAARGSPRARGAPPRRRGLAGSARPVDGRAGGAGVLRPRAGDARRRDARSRPLAQLARRPGRPESSRATSTNARKAGDTCDRLGKYRKNPGTAAA